jgi:hypothetical protein
MNKLSFRLALAVLLTAFGIGSAEASRISVNEQAESGGTIINDGSGDVSSSNGSSTGFTTIMADLGLSDLTLQNDLANLRIDGSVTNEIQQSAVAPTSADLSALRVYGTVATTCATCLTLNDVKIGGSLSLNPSGNTQNVLFAFDVIGNGLTGTTWGTSVTPGGLATQNVQLDASLEYQLSAAQIQFILDRMAGYSVDQVSIGLGARATGVNGLPTGEPVQTVFETRTVPEPGTLALLAVGAIPVMLRRRRANH